MQFNHLGIDRFLETAFGNRWNYDFLHMIRVSTFSGQIPFFLELYKFFNSIFFVSLV